MKVILNPQITAVLEDIQKQFPNGTAMTHIVNLAIREYYKQLSSSTKDNNESNTRSGREKVFKELAARP